MTNCQAYIYIYIYICGNLRCVDMLGNVLGRPRHASQRPRHMEAWWYTTPLASQLIRQQVGRFFFNVGLLGPCEKACRGRQGRCQACLERCKTCLGRCEACRGRPRTLPSMPRSCQVSLHILDSHNIYYIIILDQP